MRKLSVILFFNLLAIYGFCQEPGFKISFSLQDNGKPISIYDSTYKITGQYLDSASDKTTQGLLSCGSREIPTKFSFCLWGTSNPAIEYIVKVQCKDIAKAMEIRFHVTNKQEELVSQIDLGSLLFKKGTYMFKASTTIVPKESEWIKK